MTPELTDASTPIDRVRAIALLLPEVEERDEGGLPVFVVDDVPFAQLTDDETVCVRTADADEQADALESDPDAYEPADDLGPEPWIGMTLGGDPDWTLIEDRIAHSWELAAPERLLEAGGR